MILAALADRDKSWQQLVNRKEPRCTRINAYTIHTRTGEREREAERVGYIVLKLCHDINGTLLRSTPYIHRRWLAEIFIAFWSVYRWPAACYCRKSFDLFTAMVSIISSFLFSPFRFTWSISRSFYPRFPSFSYFSEHRLGSMSFGSSDLTFMERKGWKRIYFDRG